MDLFIYFKPHFAHLISVIARDLGISLTLGGTPRPKIRGLTASRAKCWGYKVSQTPKLTKPDRAAPAAKRVQNPCSTTPYLCTSAEQHQCLCDQLQLEQGRESLVKYAQQEKILQKRKSSTI